jgi:hypothetical protein
VLAGPGLGDNAPLAHSHRQERLADRVVDLVGARMVQVFPLQDHPGADAVAEPDRLGNRGRPAHEFAQEVLEFRPE